jgi:hypothetical protein
MDRDSEINDAAGMTDHASDLLGDAEEAQSHSPDEYRTITAVAVVACAKYLGVIADVLISQEGR